MQDHSLNVRLAAVKSTAAFLGSLGDERVVMDYIQGMDHILNIIIKAVEDGNWGQNHLKGVLNQLAELTELFPRI